MSQKCSNLVVILRTLGRIPVRSFLVRTRPKWSGAAQHGPDHTMFRSTSLS